MMERPFFAVRSTRTLPSIRQKNCVQESPVWKTLPPYSSAMNSPASRHSGSWFGGREDSSGLRVGIGRSPVLAQAYAGSARANGKARTAMTGCYS